VGKLLVAGNALRVGVVELAFDGLQRAAPQDLADLTPQGSQILLDRLDLSGDAAAFDALQRAAPQDLADLTPQGSQILLDRLDLSGDAAEAIRGHQFDDAREISLLVHLLAPVSTFGCGEIAVQVPSHHESCNHGHRYPPVLPVHVFRCILAVQKRKHSSGEHEMKLSERMCIFLCGNTMCYPYSDRIENLIKFYNIYAEVNQNKKN